MELVTATEDHLRTLMGWLPDGRACRQWGGPRFRYPFSEQTFRQDCRWGEVASRMLVDGDELLAFGQYYPRLGRCHLGRLIVSPTRRGSGLGRALVAILMRRGCADLGVGECSLFVLKDNPGARALYRKLGFEEADYPESMEWLDLCDYMVAPRTDNSNGTG